MITIPLQQISGDTPAPSSPGRAVTRNACKLCSPLGASVVFKGIAGAIPFLHGSQGCATYIRRYVISHFKEPMDIASSNFSEHSAIFGGGENLHRGLANVIRQYQPALVGIATTCLSETIGDDVPQLLHQFTEGNNALSTLPRMVAVSTPSYAGSHVDGFHAAVLAIVKAFAQPAPDSPAPSDRPLLLHPNFVSPADLRHLKEILAAFGIRAIVLPDYSETLDGPAWSEYQKLPAGGTTLADLGQIPHARATIEFSRTLSAPNSAAGYLQTTRAIPAVTLGLPIGIRDTDAFFAALSTISGRPTPDLYEAERGRLVDAYVDGHKYLFGKRVAIIGDPDLVVGLASFCSEIGLVPTLCATGTPSPNFESALRPLIQKNDNIRILTGVDYADIGEITAQSQPDILIGSSKAYSIARSLNVPLVRAGFPIHDRVGGQRTLHLGYRGTQMLFDRIVNALLEHRQEANDIGYSYM